MSNACQPKVEQKLAEVFKWFQHDAPLLKTNDSRVEVGRKFDQIQA